jgi:hypothetical protein
VTQRLVFVQSDRWCKRFGGMDAGMGVYDEALCAYCARPVRPDAVRLRTARTNDGEWWLVAADVDLLADEWRDFQTWPDGSRAPTLLPIGPDCLRQHPEFTFAVVAPAIRACSYGKHLGPTRLGHGRLHGAPLEAWICESCGKDITDEVVVRKKAGS